MSASDLFIVGRHTYGDRAVISRPPGSAGAKVVVGAFCSIANGVRFILGGEHHTHWTSTFPFHEGWENEKPTAWGRGDIEIGNDVWIGSDVLFLSGSKVGDGAVIGARTVVSGSVKPYSIVVGNPMRFVRWRFPEMQRHELERLRWWAWPDAQIKRAVPYLLDPDVERFLRMAKSGEFSKGEA